MKHYVEVVITFALFFMVIFMATSRPAHSDSGEMKALFVNSNGRAIELDMHNRILRENHARVTPLIDCSDRLQTCLTDQRGFAFAYFKKCNDAIASNYKLLRFRPKFVAVVHNDLWIVFDASPNYMFHYVAPKGIVGIYVGSAPSFDFRTLFHDSALKIANLDAMEYRLRNKEAVAPCAD